MTTTDTYFDSTAREYDDRALRAMPRYEEMLEQVVLALPPSAQDILELGCGTGALTRFVAQKFPIARFRAIDASPHMIEVAKERLANAGVLADHVQYQVSAFEELDLRPGTYDLITANMSLHHIVDKAPFYASMRVALRAAGALVFGDELLGGTREIERRHYDAWLDFARRPGGLSPDELRDIIRHDELYDHYETLSRQLALLAEAGFGQVDCTWRYLNYAVFVAVP